MTHLGKPMGVLALVAVASGLAVLHRPPAPRTDLTVWVFTEDEAATFREPAGGGRSLIEQFRQNTGKSVHVELLAQRALDGRLMSLFLADDPAAEAPDLVEIDLGSVAKFLRPPTSDIGLLALNPYLEESGDMQRLLPSRLVTWSKHGIIYGIPRDVHPVTLTYRNDLFDQAGVDLESAGTWPRFQQACLAFQSYWSAHGQPQRRAMELYTTQSEELLMILLQRHINLVDDNGGIHLTDPGVAQTVAFYAQLVAGPSQSTGIAADTIPGTPFGYRDLADGSICAMFTPDWRTAYLKEYAPELAGKLRMMPLPVFEAGDAPTSTWGGTMIGIPRACKDPKAAWELLRFLCLGRTGLEARQAYSDIIPPVKELWNDPIYQKGDPFFGGQAIDKLFISLARQIPSRCMTPLSINAQSALTLVLNKAVSYANERGTDGLQDACAGWLKDADAELREWLRQGEQ